MSSISGINPLQQRGLSDLFESRLAARAPALPNVGDLLAADGGVQRLPGQSAGTAEAARAEISRRSSGTDAYAQRLKGRIRTEISAATVSDLNARSLAANRSIQNQPRSDDRRAPGLTSIPEKDTANNGASIQARISPLEERRTGNADNARPTLTVSARSLVEDRVTTLTRTFTGAEEGIRPQSAGTLGGKLDITI